MENGFCEQLREDGDGSLRYRSVYSLTSGVVPWTPLVSPGPGGAKEGGAGQVSLSDNSSPSSTQ